MFTHFINLVTWVTAIGLNSQSDVIAKLVPTNTQGWSISAQVLIRRSPKFPMKFLMPKSQAGDIHAHVASSDWLVGVRKGKGKTTRKVIELHGEVFNHGRCHARRRASLIKRCHMPRLCVPLYLATTGPPDAASLGVGSTGRYPLQQKPSFLKHRNHRHHKLRVEVCVCFSCSTD